MNQTWHDRMEIYLKEIGLSATKMEDICGFGNGSLTKALRGKKSLGSDKFEKIFSTFPDLSANWIFKNIGEMLLSQQAHTMDMVAEDFIVYLKKGQDTQQILIELKQHQGGDRYKQLVDYIEAIINDLSLENSTLKNKLLKLYETKDELVRLIESKL